MTLINNFMARPITPQERAIEAEYAKKVTPNVIERAIQNPDAFKFLPEAAQRAIDGKLTQNQLKQLNDALQRQFEQEWRTGSKYRFYPSRKLRGDIFFSFPGSPEEAKRLSSDAVRKIFNPTPVQVPERQTTIQQIQQLLIKLTQLLQRLETESKPSKA